LKYPIQERYLALLYLTLSNLASTLDLNRSALVLPLTDLNTLFMLAFAGYSSELQIIHLISSTLLDTFMIQ